MRLEQIVEGTRFYQILSREDLEIIKKMGYDDGDFIGKGGFGRVFLTNNGSIPCAVKYQVFGKEKDKPFATGSEDTKYYSSYSNIPVTPEDGSGTKRKKFLKQQGIILELKSLIDLNHPCIVNIFNIYSLKNGNCLIFMEYCPGGDLNQLIRGKSAAHKKALRSVKYKRELKGKDINVYHDHPDCFIGELEASRFYIQIADALKYCHGQGIAHLDIKPANILLDEYQTFCKVCDFGIVKNLFDIRTAEQSYPDTGGGTPSFMPPEYFYELERDYDYTKNDVWAMGVTLHQMCNGYESGMPFDHECFDTTYEYLSDRDIDIVEMIRNLKNRNSKLSKEAKKFIARHFIYDPLERPSFAELLQDRFLDKAANFLPHLRDSTVPQAPVSYNFPTSTPP